MSASLASKCLGDGIYLASQRAQHDRSLATKGLGLRHHKKAVVGYGMSVPGVRTDSKIGRGNLGCGIDK